MLEFSFFSGKFVLFLLIPYKGRNKVRVVFVVHDYLLLRKMDVSNMLWYAEDERPCTRLGSLVSVPHAEIHAQICSKYRCTRLYGTYCHSSNSFECMQGREGYIIGCSLYRPPLSLELSYPLLYSTHPAANKQTYTHAHTHHSTMRLINK